MHVPVCCPPIYGVPPVHPRVGGRTSVYFFRFHLLYLFSRFAKLSRVTRPCRSQPTFVEGDVACARPLSVPLQSGLRFFCTPLPAISSAHLTARFPLISLHARKITGLPRSVHGNIDRLGLSYPPAALFAHDRKDSSSCARCCAFWLKPGDYAFSLSLVTAFIRHSHVLTLLSNSSPFPLRHFGERTCLMACALAFARGYIVGGALQGGLAVPPHPPRSLLKKW